MLMMLPFGRNLNRVIFPSSQRRGGCAIKKMPRSHKSGRRARSASAIARSRNTRSASAIARSRNSGQFGWPSKGRRTDLPVRDKSERIHFLDVADTPPLRGGECARRKTLSKKLKVAALLHKEDSKDTKKSLLCFLCSSLCLLCTFPDLWAKPQA